MGFTQFSSYKSRMSLEDWLIDWARGTAKELKKKINGWRVKGKYPKNFKRVIGDYHYLISQDLGNAVRAIVEGRWGEGSGISLATLRLVTAEYICRVEEQAEKRLRAARKTLDGLTKGYRGL